MFGILESCLTSGPWGPGGPGGPGEHPTAGLCLSCSSLPIPPFNQTYPESKRTGLHSVATCEHTDTGAPVCVWEDLQSFPASTAEVVEGRVVAEEVTRDSMVQTSMAYPATWELGGGGSQTGGSTVSQPRRRITENNLSLTACSHLTWAVREDAACGGVTGKGPWRTKKKVEGHCSPDQVHPAGPITHSMSRQTHTHTHTLFLLPA